MSEHAREPAPPEPDRRRDLQRAGLLASRAMLAADPAEPEAALSRSLATAAEALDVGAVALVSFDPRCADAAVVDVVWSPEIGGARRLEHPLSLAELPDLDELTVNGQVVRLRVNQLPSELAARMGQFAIRASDLIAVPVVGEDEVIGALVVLAPPEREWTGPEVALAESVALSAFMLLIRHRRDEHLTRQIADSELLAGFGRAVVEAGPRLDSDVVPSILEGLGSHLDADALVAFERRGDRARPFAAWYAIDETEAEPLAPTQSQWAAMMNGQPTSWHE